jgi:hypothetical protein
LLRTPRQHHQRHTRDGYHPTLKSVQPLHLFIDSDFRSLLRIGMPIAMLIVRRLDCPSVRTRSDSLPQSASALGGSIED